MESGHVASWRMLALSGKLTTRCLAVAAAAWAGHCRALLGKRSRAWGCADTLMMRTYMHFRCLLPVCCCRMRIEQDFRSLQSHFRMLPSR